MQNIFKLPYLLFFLAAGAWATDSRRQDESVWISAEEEQKEMKDKKKSLRQKALENPRNKGFSESFQNVGGNPQQKEEGRKKKTGD